ncbi:NAD-dependent epimerase [Actinophytocola sp.]|uniref:NAD-dependent epimerase n=1 Tax=Actinophytocola sp. TaxID=1872138 RepID=UPI002ED4EEE4
MSGLHVIVGAGPVGTATAELLAARGDKVRVVTRSGGGLAHPGVERVAADATDADRLSELAEGAVALYNCASPQYHRWLTDWPPIAESLLTAAERSGAVLATASNLYGYGEVDGPITPETPLAAAHPKLKIRADLWRAALARHEAGRIRVTEVRGSDYIEANSIFNAVLATPLRAGKRALVPTALDMPHSWTSIADVAQTLVTVAADERAWGKGWLVPTNAPLTVRELAQRFTEVHGLPPAKLATLPYAALWTAGLFSPMIRELRATHYQFTRPFVMDSSATEQTFALAPTNMDAALKNVS